MKRTVAETRESSAIRELILGLSPKFRAGIGALVVSVASVYGVLLFITIFGVWRKNLGHIEENLFFVCLMFATNVIAFRTKRLLIVNASAAVLFLTYAGLMFGLTARLQDLPQWWPVAVALVGTPLVNFFLFSQWLRAFHRECGRTEPHT